MNISMCHKVSCRDVLCRNDSIQETLYDKH